MWTPLSDGGSRRLENRDWWNVGLWALGAERWAKLVSRPVSCYCAVRKL